MNLLRKIKERISKSFIPNSFTTESITPNRNTGRGYTVYNTSELVKISARGKDNQIHNVDVEIGYSTIDPITAFTVCQKCAPLFGLINKRAFRVSSTEWNVIPKVKFEDKLVSQLRDVKQIYNEYLNDNSKVGYQIKVDCLTTIYQNLPTVKPDLSNFESALHREMKRLRSELSDRCNEIEDYLSVPSPNMSMGDLLKSIVSDLLIHGRVALYKQNLIMGNTGNLYCLAGGTVYPIRSIYASNTIDAYIQNINNLEESQIFFPNEIMYSNYMPNSSTAYGVTPIDALINLMTEYIYFEEQSLEKANEFEPPQKLIVFGQPNDFSSDTDFGGDTPDSDEQRRIENKLNNKQRKKAIATLTGYGTPLAVDISKNDVYDKLMARQDQILKLIAIALSASNNEINDNNNNLATSKVNERYDLSSGLAPIYGNIEDMFNNEYLKFKYGLNYYFEFNESQTELDRINVAKTKLESGLMSVNEVRVNELGLEPYPEDDYNRPNNVSQNSDQSFMEAFKERFK